MIGIARSPDPPALAGVRAEKLTAARAASAAGAKVEFSGHEVAKEALAAMQHLKCCYCEKREEQAEYRDVEHYRPKARYWWLAWTWENLLFACIDCNREHKRESFPLSPGDVRLVAEQAPPGTEHPLVLDPSDAFMDPAREIEFRRAQFQAKERWVPHGVTARGRETIAVCGLDRPALLDLYADHVTQAVRPKLEGFFSAHETGDAQAAFHAWERTKRSLLHPARPFRALSHDALNALVSPELRDRYRLTLDRPGR